MNRSHYYIYPKDKHGNKTGHTICVLIKDGKIFHGMSLCSAEDQFAYTKGRELSLVRAEEAFTRFEARQIAKNQEVS